MVYDLIIIGGGPAGAAAGVYAARKKLKTFLLTFDWGGQSVVSADIQNWVGTKSISGETLARQLKEHVRMYEGPDLKIVEGQKAQKISPAGGNFMVETDTGEKFETKTALIATGADRRRLEVPGAKEFEQKGITYCATCDGPLFADRDVAVIGGGNAAFETAAQLLAYCKSVTLLNRSDKFRADPITIEKVKQNPKFKIITNAEPREFKGDKFVNKIIYKDAASGESRELATDGVFVEIGLLPTTYFIKDLVKLNQYNQIEVDPRTQRTSVPGIWAAGDATDGLYHQNNISAGDAVKALEDIYNYLHLAK
ncbi:MAG: FAD-dependent oxidoreductase [Candidatus Vogelbacteria bacterium]|nr:FAD-dependent oxidoreductase [Candidatus Vogelbacteria bacterium]